MNTPKRVLMVSSEYAPLAKSGGLADAVASLATALRRNGVDLRVLIPRYGFIPKGKLELLPGSLGVPIGVREEWVAVYRWESQSGVPVYLIDHEELYGRTGIYNEEGLDYADNPRRFALLSYSAFQLSRMLHWIPEVIHAHDWPTGLVPVFLESRERQGEFEKTASLFTIHNIGYQGIFAPEQFIHTKLPWEDYERLGLSFEGSLNMLNGALRNADVITTVSERYAEEIRTPEFSFGLHETLRRRDGPIYGVLNGIDLEEWNPEEDEYLPTPFSPEDPAGKKDAKLELQRQMGLPEDPDTPLVGFVARLAEQKGIKYLFMEGGGAMDRLCREERIQCVVLASGDPNYEELIRRSSLELPNLSAHLGYDNQLAHLIEGGADFLLMPSEYEPCGLNQMYSMRYGTIPIVSDTGGLADTVADESEGSRATGFIIEGLTTDSVVAAVQRAVKIYRSQPERIEELRATGMCRDFSWKRSALRYQELYEEALRRRSRS
ncbi:MAG: glycogen synthase [Spirochaetaceae bacterium]